MNRYTIYCTEEQTKKALKLGAPITNIHTVGNDGITKEWELVNPTAEQMIGWLEEQGVVIDILSHYIRCYDFEKRVYEYDCMINDEYVVDVTYKSRKEVTLVAINAALDYLTNNKK